MNQIMTLLMCMALTLSLASCGTRSTPAVPAVPDACASGEEEESEPGSVSGQENEEPDVSISVAFSEVDASTFAEDGTMLVDCIYVEPVVTMADPTVQAKIQETLDEVIGGVKGTCHFYTEMSQEEYDTVGQEDSFAMMDEEGNYLPYYLHLEGKVTRADEKVVSIVFDQNMYTHGAHGGTSRFACNYDAQTGEVLTFDQLGEEFRSTAEELVLAKADEMAAEYIQKGEADPFYPEYADSIHLVVIDGTETSDEVWGPEMGQGDAPAGMAPTYYLSEESIVFVSNEYTLQPFAAGIIEFEIPYADFGDVLNSNYNPQ